MATFKIYAIRSESQPELVYIGSTKQALRRRFQNHESNYRSYLNGKQHYVTSFKLLEIGDAYIELLAEYQNLSKDELNEYEAGAIRLHATVNKNIPGRSVAQYRQDNKDKMKQYAQKNKNRIQRYKFIYDAKRKLAKSQQRRKQDIDQYNELSKAFE